MMLSARGRFAAATVAIAAMILVALALGFPALAETSTSGGALVLWAGNNNEGVVNLYTMPLDGGSPTRLTTDGGYGHPSISSDGMTIAYIRADALGQQQVWVMNADGSDTRQLTTQGGRGPSISPDGSSVVFMSNRDGTWEVYSINVDGSGEAKLTDRTTHDYIYAGGACLSPDGSTIAFFGERATGYGDVWLMDADGSNQRRLTDTTDIAESSPAFSPDGGMIVFAVTSPSIGNELDVMHVDGTERRRVATLPGVERDPAFTPDGQCIVYSSTRSDPYGDLYVIDVDGTGDRLLNAFRYHDYEPVCWTPPMDADPPVITIVSPTRYGVYAVEGAETYGFSAQDSGAGVDTLQAILDGQDEVTNGTPLPDQAGVYTLVVSATDHAGNTATEELMFVVYDPSAGFVTGGGWVDSPPGAYYDDPTLHVRATFGFVSRYKKDATVPSGATEFQFHSGGLDFHSSTQQWLIVNQNGENAQFKCTGTVNGDLAPGSEPFDCMIWAGDHTDGDTFRIRIWYEDAEGLEYVVYDNGVCQPIGGGSIIVHE